MDIELYKNKALAMVSLWKSVELPHGGLSVADVTPYVHMALHHVPAMLKRQGSMAPFSGQALERNMMRVRTLGLRKCNFRLLTLEQLQYDIITTNLLMAELRI